VPPNEFMETRPLNEILILQDGCFHSAFSRGCRDLLHVFIGSQVGKYGIVENAAIYSKKSYFRTSIGKIIEPGKTLLPIGEQTFIFQGAAYRTDMVFPKPGGRFPAHGARDDLLYPAATKQLHAFFMT